jgi:hypothetical protein
MRLMKLAFQVRTLAEGIARKQAVQIRDLKSLEGCLQEKVEWIYYLKCQRRIKKHIDI